MKKLYPEDYLGNVYKTNNYGELKIVSFVNSKNVTVEFISTGFLKKTTLCKIRCGKLKDPFYPYFYGKGYLGTEDILDKKVYSLWKGIMRRCYSKENLPRHTSYKDVKVCKDWWCYFNFYTWYTAQNSAYKEGFHLDKDIMSFGEDYKEYSPKYCRLIPSSLNTMFKRSNETKYTGVHLFKGSYYVQSAYQNKSTYLGKVKDKQEGAKVYQQFRRDIMKTEIQKHRDVLDEDVILKIREIYSIT